MIVNKELAISEGHLQKDLWATPDYIFSPLDIEFGFTLDPCCTIETAKCAKFYTPSEDGLIQDWSGERVFVNPPYSRGNIDKWVKKCFLESSAMQTIVVALIPVSTSAKWFHEWVLNKAELRFYRGRIRFVGAPFTAPFSSVLAIYGGRKTQIFNRL
jgi:site-specific DNA-methyltransferase (adenine-specific)